MADRRSKVTCFASAFMIVFALLWACLSVAIADTIPEKPITEGDLVRAQWWLISGLLGLVLIVSQGFILYVVSGVKSNIRKLFELHEHVLTDDTHDRLDHSTLCAVCRPKAGAK